jgi:hypothetical protein
MFIILFAAWGELSASAGTPCSCVGNPSSKRYEWDSQIEQRQSGGEKINYAKEKQQRTNFSFYCDYTCYDKSGNQVSIEKALHIRTTRPGREPPESEMRCGGLHYSFHDNPNNLSRPIPEPPEPQTKSVGAKSDDSFFGFLGMGRDEFDSQKVQDWAKSAGCR